ncbi:hypothetical protein GCM10023201_52480 [Actinomycetospora corticicola]|uniref:Uncharacterized protein n=1 Tax=Actinomycetospora corticicola TaxID=663602 RepID=A0A7Y9DY14_9PSEU|nr:hypothetical protein [Actinomycetospora corticicola]NYD37490.1 hypothetical protein [Actinomycetospora corticicola]
MTHVGPATGPTSDATRTRRREPAAVLRTGALVLAGISVAATAFELASERHWNDLEQLIPWAALVVLLAAIGAVLVPRAATLTLSRVLAAIVLAASLYGIVDHTVANHDAGALDGRYSATWEDLPVAQQWWYAATKTVGPAPTLAPGVLGQAALLVLLAGIGRRDRAASRHRT